MYRQSHSCEDALAVCIDSWQHSLDNGNVVAVAMLDLSKAVDCVQHDRRHLELPACGIGGKALAWLCSVLSSRQQQVVCRRNPPGEHYPANRGVPQGSWSASVLYARSLPTSLVFSTSQLYADDTNVYGADKTADAVIEKA